MESHLLQMRGLKRQNNSRNNLEGWVASFTDAWIETGWKKSLQGCYHVASFTDAWIETVILVVNIGGCEVASFTDAWIETIM